ncbi:MAG: metal-dependent hydrolase [Phycisphaerae bacterium]
MDSITQGMLGAATAQLGFRQKLGRDATWVAAFAAYSPDLDSFIAPVLGSLGYVDPFASMLYHRWITHSLLMIPLTALLFAGPWWLVRRGYARYKRRRGEQQEAPSSPFGLLFLCCLVAAATHAPLDWCTSYGTQLLSPFTDARYAIDVVAIVDIIYTPLLILTLLVCFIVRRGRKNIHRKATVVIGAAGLLLSTGYLCVGRWMHNRAVAEALQELNLQPQQVKRAEAYPMIGTIFLWQAVVETPEDWHIVRVHHFADPQGPRKTLHYAKPPENEWIRRARQTRGFRIYNWFSDDMVRFSHTRTSDGSHVVTMNDMRYAFYNNGGRSIWPVTVTFPPGGGEPVVERLRGRPGRDMRDFAATIWADLTNP